LPARGRWTGAPGGVDSPIDMAASGVPLDTLGERVLPPPVMANALFAFDDLASAQRAAERAAARLPPEAVSVHTKDLGRSDSLFDQADEAVVSGGMLRNLYDLFQGIFEWGSSPHDASHFEEMVRKGGAVVSVDTTTPEQRRAIDDAMRSTGFERRTDWAEA
jgi:hypothetical protein